MHGLSALCAVFTQCILVQKIKREMEIWTGTTVAIEDQHQQLDQAAGKHIELMWETDLKGKMQEVVRAV